jgi:hypothetical protein
MFLSTLHALSDTPREKIPPLRSQSTYTLLSKKLYGYGGASSYGFTQTAGAKMVHTLVGFYPVDLSSDPMQMVVASSYPDRGCDCKTCAPKMSYFLFRYTQGKWTLIRSEINVHALTPTGTTTPRRHQATPISTRKYISTPLRNGYRAIATASKNRFNFTLEGDGDALDITLTPTAMTSSHIFGVFTECKRIGENTLIQCEDFGADTGTVRYRFDGRFFDLTIASEAGGKHTVERFYNDENHLYWSSRKEGESPSIQSFTIRR